MDENGAQLGIIKKEDALSKALDLGLDLVEVSPDSDPPVCRILNYGKYKYKQNKKSHKKTHTVQLKEIRVRPKIGEHDLQTKVKQARKFVERSDRVLINMMFRGREMRHKENAQDVFDVFIKALEDIAKVETLSKAKGRNISIILTPIK
ncbi:MAG: translation initiation factor IF-3 [Candidatus Scalindua sp.]|nr:translation initiation factor IF-3 [Candidatus Scalindua sp.]